MRVISKLFRCDLPHCPYCGVRLFYLEALNAKNRSSLKCPRCRKKSEVILEPIMFKLLGLIQILSLVTFAIVIFLSFRYCLLGLIFITLLFGGFYVFSPFMVNLAARSSTIMQEKQRKNEENTGESSDEEIFSN